MQPVRLALVGFFLVLTGAVLPFVIILGFLESTFFLNFLAFGASVAGMFLGVLAAAQYVGRTKQKQERRWWESES